MSKHKNIGLRLDDVTRKKLKYVAEYDGRSMSNLVLRLVQECIRKFEGENGPIEVE